MNESLSFMTTFTKVTLVMPSVAYLMLDPACFVLGMFHTRFLRPKLDAHRMYAQDQIVIHTVRM
jgi:hypothetical protein